MGVWKDSEKVRKCEGPGEKSRRPSGAGKPAAGKAVSPVSRRGAARTGLQLRYCASVHRDGPRRGSPRRRTSRISSGEFIRSGRRTASIRPIPSFVRTEARITAGDSSLDDGSHPARRGDHNRSFDPHPPIRIRQTRGDDARSEGHPQPRRIHPPVTRIQANGWRHASYGPCAGWPFTSALPYSRTHGLSQLSRAERGPAIMYAHPASSGGPFMSRNAAHV